MEKVGRAILYVFGGGTIVAVAAALITLFPLGVPQGAASLVGFGIGAVAGLLVGIKKGFA